MLSLNVMIDKPRLWVDASEAISGRSIEDVGHLEGTPGRLREVRADAQ